MGIMEFVLTPHLASAVLLMATEGGIISRYVTADDVRVMVRGAVASAFTPQELAEVETELSLLSNAELQARTRASEITRKVLDVAWDAMQ